MYKDIVPYRIFDTNVFVEYEGERAGEYSYMLCSQEPKGCKETFFIIYFKQSYKEEKRMPIYITKSCFKKIKDDNVLAQNYILSHTPDPELYFEHEKYQILSEKAGNKEIFFVYSEDPIPITLSKKKMERMFDDTEYALRCISRRFKARYM